MNVFVLSTGRSGTVTFIEACKHITNYTAEHESNMGRVGPDRLRYPPKHIEADNRLSWFLGRLDEAYGRDALYVHLKRDRTATATSYARRMGRGLLVGAYWRGIYYGIPPDTEPLVVCGDLYDTVHANIELFLRDKPHQMTFSLENATEDFTRFWELASAEGSLESALDVWNVRFNAAPERPRWRRFGASVVRVAQGMRALVRQEFRS